MVCNSARARRQIVALVLPIVIAGCGEEPQARDDAQVPPMPIAPLETDGALTPSELREKLGANRNAEIRETAGRITHVKLSGAGVEDISALKGLPLVHLDLRGLPVSDLTPLAGMPLRELFLEETPVRDLAPLAGMPLDQLYLNQTLVETIEPLAGMPIEQLNLQGTPLDDLSPVATMEIGTLWIPQTQVADLTPLRGRSLVSLDAEETPVADLTPLAEMNSLKRLNIAGTFVTDLTPLDGLGLERLIFTPSRITQGLDVIRSMPTLTELGPSFEERSAPAEFWRRYAAGEFSNR
ncbi:MAG: hypothetical protein KY476_04580 [Planctomycetes bacterium]|nr:hypothetical protein [Planctomycetota bacterium]